MLRDYIPLPVTRLQPGATFYQPTQYLPPRVGLDNPAVDVMTDFKRVSVVVVEPTATLDDASNRMILRKVRLLVVVDDNNSVLGLITATDILSERPMQIVQERGMRRNEILVRDVMTPQDKLEVLNMDDVLHARVGHIVSTLKKAGRQHALVVDNNGEEDAPGLYGVKSAGPTQTVRGLFSTSQIARQLGAQIQTTEIARTFAEIEAFLSH